MLFLPIIVLLAAQTVDDRVTSTLKTPHYTIHITELCHEDVACDRVVYQSVSTTGKTLTLHGRRTVVMCADGVTPCHPVGYFFKNGPYEYRIDDGGELVVTMHKRVLIDEKGEWSR